MGQTTFTKETFGSRKALQNLKEKKSKTTNSKVFLASKNAYRTLADDPTKKHPDLLILQAKVRVLKSTR